MGGGALETAPPGLTGSIPWRGRTPGEHRSRREVNPERRETDSGEVPCLEGGQHVRTMPRATRGTVNLSRTGQPVSKDAKGTSTGRAANVKKVAGAERRHGFVRREKLWRGATP